MLRGFERVSYIKDGVVPTRKTASSAGYDISVVHGGVIPPHTTKVFDTGIKAFMRPDEVLMIYIRSSIGIKRGLMLSNSTGIIDSDYYNNDDNEGHIMIALYNNTDEEVTIQDGERVAQGVFLRYYTSGEQIKTERKGGIGSTNG